MIYYDISSYIIMIYHDTMFQHVPNIVTSTFQQRPWRTGMSTWPRPPAQLLFPAWDADAHDPQATPNRRIQ